VMNELPIDDIAAAVAGDIPEGSYVNLGIGLPSKVAAHVPAGREVIFHCENGILGMGPPPAPGAEDLDLVDAGKQPVTLMVGGSYISHADSFAVIRGGHLDLAVLGAYEVSAGGDLANWSTGSGVPAVGGAMDLAVGARGVWAVMRHTTREGAPKIVTTCSMPLTGSGVVNRVYTELGIFQVGDGAVRAMALVEGCDVDELSARTGAPLVVPDGVRVLPVDFGSTAVR
jgi:3-oxoadipate CoA-transferase beta subunit